MLGVVNIGLVATIFFGVLGVAGALGLVLAYVRGNLAKATIETLEKNSSALEKRVGILENENKALNDRLVALEETKKALTEAVTSRADVDELSRFTKEGFEHITESLKTLTDQQAKVTELLTKAMSNG